MAVHKRCWQLEGGGGQKFVKLLKDKAKLLQEATLVHHHFYLPEILYQSKMAMEQAFSVLNRHFGPL